tara:strand:- start:3371 stop:3562 length:192 start_codon:yes stop_codon:yes gene_type:complete
MSSIREIKETYEWRLQGFRDEVKRLVAENNRLREAIADVATNMEAADASYMGEFIEDLWKVIE